MLPYIKEVILFCSRGGIGVEVLVLLGGFAAIFVCGYILMSKLDDWLAAPQNKEDID